MGGRIITTGRRIAPKLRNNRSRESYSGRLPDYVKSALRREANSYGISMSWYLEQQIVHALGVRRPQYVTNTDKK